MSKSDAAQTIPASTPPLSWPPPGLERLQGGLWLVIGLAWTGSLVLALPLLWTLAVEQPFYSLGPFEENWRIGVGISIVGAILVAMAFGHLFALMRSAARAADMGYGTLTILEVACDSGRDTGFLIQGKRHFAGLDDVGRAKVVRGRLLGAVLLLVAALWVVIGFGLAILLAARGFVTPSGIWLMSLGPSGVLALLALFFLIKQNSTVRELQTQWDAQEGAGRVRVESANWNERLQAAGDTIALGSGRRGDAGRFRVASAVVALAFLLAFGPATTVALTTAIGPILAEIAVPTFLAVQGMAGGAEILRRFQLEPDPSVSASRAGTALQNLAFVGSDGDTEPWERSPGTLHPLPWFPTAGSFPDPYSESVAYDLMIRPLEAFSADQRAALLQAAEHAAQSEFETLARAELVDVVTGRWTLPFPDTMTFQDLPWPRFPAFRLAGLARVSKAAAELGAGRPEQAETTLRDLISTGFLLIDQGPTLIDNLMGVELTRMGGDALEAFYRRTGRADQADALEWARAGALSAARKARAGLVGDDVRGLLQGVPDLVENEEALRGLRWEYFATFNMLAPCINLQRMVFGPGDTLDAWRRRAERSIVRLPGERELFDLAEHGVLGAGSPDATGVLPRFLGLVLGSGGTPGSCASLIASLQS
jgi:hypothetical protein